jgi:hypothetical protein
MKSIARLFGISGGRIHRSHSTLNVQPILN